MSETTPDSSGTTEIAAFMPGSASSLQNLAAEYPELIALPDSIGAKQNPFQNAWKLQNAPSAGLGSGDAGQRKSSSLSALVSLTLKGSFNQIFSSVFRKSNEEPLTAKDDVPNPFTEAKEKEPAPQPETKPTEAEKPAAKAQNTASDPKPQPTSAATVIPASGDGAAEYALVIGDFNGSGVLAVSKAMRVSDTRFVAADGAREFELLVNSNALELRSSFCVEDLNGDGNPDLLVAQGPAPFGSVLLGDANNSFHYSDIFYTGFEPTVPIAGPFRDGKREILSVDMRSGEVHVFRGADRYTGFQSALFPLVPDYLLHLVKSDNSTDFALTAQTGGASQLLGWNDDGTVGVSSEALAANPLTLTANIGADFVQGYQVGNYASIVLSSQGQSFNIANFRLFPKIFLVIGNLQRNGAMDVAIGNLKSFTPAN